MNYLHIFIVFSVIFKLCSCCWETYDCTEEQAITHCGLRSSCRIETGLLSDEIFCQCTKGGQWPNCVECTRNSHCRFDQACVDDTCKNPCDGTACGQGAICYVTDHEAACQCPGLTYGDPYQNCVKCLEDSHCMFNEACIGNTCKDSCFEHCGRGAGCYWGDHRGHCYCPNSNFSHLDSNKNCVECLRNSHCQPDQVCVDNTCKNPCDGVECGNGAKCGVIDHQAKCQCPTNTVLDSNNNCLECISNSHCRSDQACVDNTCKNPCDGVTCGQGAKCDVTDHQAKCQCPTNTVLDSNNNCLECISNSHCRFDQACVDDTCKNPCDGTACGQGAMCYVTDHEAACQCPGLTYGDPYQNCVECLEDSHCMFNEACIGNTCKDSCFGHCGRGAGCYWGDHRGHCYCPNSNFSHLDSNKNCVECLRNSHCQPDQVCVDNKCKNPCDGVECGNGAKCDVIDYQAKCQCPTNTVLDSNNNCLECISNSHCRSDQACVDNTCKNPCDGVTCGQGAKCDVDDHLAKCQCPTNTVLDSNNNCLECISNSHCRSDQACVDNTCKNPCDRVTCGQGAKCDVTDHQAKCQCPTNTVLDSNNNCLECISNSHCRSDQACVDNTCKNPCDRVTCGQGAKCDVTNHQAKCICPNNTYGNPFISCVECLSNNYCHTDQACVDNTCKNPCDGACGQGAKCDVINRQAICICPDNAFGDPYEICYERKPEVPRQ